jgi:hypothetical protein
METRDILTNVIIGPYIIAWSPFEKIGDSVRCKNGNMTFIYIPATYSHSDIYILRLADETGGGDIYSTLGFREGIMKVKHGRETLGTAVSLEPLYINQTDD